MIWGQEICINWSYSSSSRGINAVAMRRLCTSATCRSMHIKYEMVRERSFHRQIRCTVKYVYGASPARRRKGIILLNFQAPKSSHNKRFWSIGCSIQGRHLNFASQTPFLAFQISSSSPSSLQRWVQLEEEGPVRSSSLRRYLAFQHHYWLLHHQRSVACCQRRSWFLLGSEAGAKKYRLRW